MNNVETLQYKFLYEYTTAERRQQLVTNLAGGKQYKQIIEWKTEFMSFGHLQKDIMFIHFRRIN